MRPLFAVAGWIAAAVVAIGIGIAGVQAIGEQITAGTGGDVLSAEEASRLLAAEGGPLPSAASPSAAPPTPTASPSAPPPSATPVQPANVGSFSVAGGTVTAGCLPGGAYLISWTPAQGYTVKQYRRGPDAEYAEVRFQSGGSGKGGGDSRVRITCVGNVPVQR